MQVNIIHRRYPGGKSAWFLRWVDENGKRRERRASDHPAERIREQRRLERRLSGESWPLVDAWKDHMQDLEPDTAVDYERALRRFVELTRCEHTIDLSRQLLRDYRARLGDLDLAPRTKNSELARVSAILHQLRRADLTPDLHSDDVIDTLRRFKVRKNPPRPYSVAKIQAMLRAIDREEPTFRPLFEFALLSGLRRAELFAIRPHWLDADAKVLHVPSRKTTRGRGVILTVSPRLVALSEDLAAITRWPEGRADYVRRLIRPKFTWQGLRVTCASYLVNSAILPAWQAARQLGHSEDVADAHYRGLVTGISRDVASLDEIFFFRP